MKKVNLMLAVAAMSALTMISNGAFAQKGNGNTFEVGSMTVNIGVGAGRTSAGASGYYGSGYYGYGTGIGVKAALEVGLWQIGPGVLSLGGEAGGSFANGLSNYKSNIVIVAVRSAYHFGWNVDKLDTYAGLSAGPGFRSYYTANAMNSSYTKHDVVIAPGGFIGASYYFSPNIGVNVEAGYDITTIQGGIVFKLK